MGILERLILLKHELSPPFRDDSLGSQWKVLIYSGQGAFLAAKEVKYIP